MRITTLWEGGRLGDAPWLVSAYDEYTEEEHNGEPDFYKKLREEDPNRRELIIQIPDAAVNDLFKTPRVTATSTKETAR